MKVRVKVLKDDRGADLGFIPERATPFAAGWDLRASEDVNIYPNQKATVRCGICIEIEDGFEGQVRSRSGLAKKNGIFVINSPGTIDSDYRGELMAMLHNLGMVPFEVKRGDRIAQLVINQLPAVCMERVAELSETGRGEAGFGSTGIK